MLPNLKKYSSFMSIIVILFILLGSIIYFSQTDFYKDDWSINYLFLLPFVVASLLIFLTNGYINNILYKHLGLNLKIKEWLGINIISSFLNYLSPLRAGTFIGAFYLKKKYKFTYSNSLFIFSVIYLVLFWILSLGILLIFLTQKLNNPIFKPLTLFALILFIFINIIIVLKPKLKAVKNTKINHLINVINYWSQFTQYPKILIQLFIFSIINLLLICLKLYFGFLILGQNANLLNLLFLAIINTLALFISLTPSNLGIKEALFVLSGTIINISADKLILLSLLDRFISIVILLILSSFFSYSLFGKSIFKIRD